VSYKAAFSAIFFLFPTYLSAEVTCNTRVMTGAVVCHSADSKVVRSGMKPIAYYSFGTDHSGKVGRIQFSLFQYNSSSKPDGFLVKLDDNPPFNAVISEVGSVDNRAVTVFVNFSASQLEKINNSSTMLVSAKDGNYVSDPITINHKLIFNWFNEWHELTRKSSL
tara:strand:+ start:203 stop:697 length:495 start_codon:yes stop_codon:yes gene_type:complete